MVTTKDIEELFHDQLSSIENKDIRDKTVAVWVEAARQGGWESVEEIKDAIGADSLGYISMDGLIEAVGLPREIFCAACFTGDYPTPVQLEMDKLQLEALPSTSVRSLSEIET